MYKIVIFFEDLLKAFTLDFSYKKRFYKILKNITKLNMHDNIFNLNNIFFILLKN